MGSSAGEGVEVDQSHGKIDRLERKPGNGTLSSAVGKPIRVPCVEYSSKGSGDTNDNGEVWTPSAHLLTFDESYAVPYSDFKLIFRFVKENIC